MLTSEVIQDELRAAFTANHGAGCSCCEPFVDGLSRLERELLVEARVAILRFEGAATAAELEDLARAAAADALEATRAAIVARAIRGLASPPAPIRRPDPVIVAIDPSTHRPICHAETFDGTYRRQCTRPASFTRDGLEVCRQHVRLASTRAHV